MCIEKHWQFGSDPEKCHVMQIIRISQWRVLHFWSLKMSCLMWKFLLYLLWNVFIQDFQWNYAVPYSVTLKDWANCAEVTCINMHMYRCKMPVFLIWLPPILDFHRSVGPYPDRRNQRGLNMSFFSAYYLPPFLCVTCNIMYFILTLCRSNLQPYCMGRKAAFFFSGHLNLRTTPETGLSSRKKNHNN